MRLLASRDGNVRVREIHLPAMDAVLHLQLVDTRCSLRLHLPQGADAPSSLRELNAPTSWSALVASARVTVLGVG